MAKEAAVTEDELKGLSDEERAALEADDDDTPAADRTDDDPEDPKDDPADDPVDDPADPADDPADPADPADPEDPVGISGSGTDDDADLLVASTMRMRVQHVDDYDTKVQELDAELTALTGEFKAGDVEMDAFLEQQRDIQRRREELASQDATARHAEEYNASADQYDWQQTLAAFWKRSAAAGVDYREAKVKRGAEDVPLIDELDRMVKLLATDPANAERTSLWCLKEADAIVRARYGLGDAPKPKADAKGKVPPSRKPNLGKLPKTLGDVPAAQDTETRGNEGEFAHLDNLDGLELEAAVRALSPTQQQRWAEAA